MGTCVLESDFGFTLNCAFKKSGLFRVRNLGGVKGYVGLGFTVGDELGFRESLSNLESNKRRSVQTRGNFIPIAPVNGVTIKRDDRDRGIGQVTRQSGSVPPFKPLPPSGVRPMGQQPERQRLMVVQQNSTALKMIPAPSFESLQQHEAAIRKQQQAQAQKLQTQQQVQTHVQQPTQAQQNPISAQQQAKDQEARLRQQQRIQQEALALQVLKQQRNQQQEAMRQQQIKKLAQQNLQQQQIIALQTKRVQVPQQTNPIVESPVYSHAMPNPVSSNPDLIAQRKPVATSNGGLPAFVAMPQSSSQLTDRISNSPTLLEDSVNEVSKDDYAPLAIPSEEAAASVNEMTLQSLHPFPSAEALKSPHEMQNDKRQAVSNLPSLAPIQGMETSLKALAEASNITLEALEAAILLRQQQLMEKQQERVITTTTTMPTPVKTYNTAGITKVMNAPREYYPNGYDKNFDDNFASRVDLPDTSFYCGDQKHFPGLYADEDLGCMVFHVCALTDEGLIMKSFLCPESTLFDQTILKCNWWFYVDCKSSKNLYDSNIPISKSYQLMKALAFFSAYKNHDGNATNVEES
ncbi:transcription factor SPT20 homolog isoform X2 [Venturia canescens]|nr:transcription factor SPT20 homolog isoform X2 [Venturia canescens]